MGGSVYIVTNQKDGVLYRWTFLAFLMVEKRIAHNLSSLKH